MTWTKTRSQIGKARQADPNADITELRAKMHREMREAKIERLISEAPPLTAEQRDRLASLLQPSLADTA